MSGESGEKEYKTLTIVLGAMAFLIVGLMIGNVVVYSFVSQRGSKSVDGRDSVTEQTPAGDYVLNDDGTSSPLEESQIGVPDEKWSVVTDGKTFEQVVAEYQTLIDQADNAKKVELLNERIRFVLNVDEWQQHKDLLLSDAIAVDNIEQSLDSATQVLNLASSVNDEALTSQYLRILNERGGVTNGADSGDNVINYNREVING